MLTAKGRTRILTDIWYRKGPSINVNNTLCTNPLFYSQHCVGETRAGVRFHVERQPMKHSHHGPVKHTQELRQSGSSHSARKVDKGAHMRIETVISACERYLQQRTTIWWVWLFSSLLLKARQEWMSPK